MTTIRKSYVKSFTVIGLLALLVFSILLILERLSTPRAQSSTANQLVQQGKILLANRTMADIVSADAKFQAALASDPNHPEANAYRAVTRVLALVSAPGSANPAVLDSVPKFLDRLGVSANGRDLYNWTADFTRNAAHKVVLPANAPNPPEIAQFLETYVLPEIDGALSNLSHLSSSFAMTLPGAIISPTAADMLLDFGEIEVYRAWLQSTRAATLFSRSYGLDANLKDVVDKLNAKTFQFIQDLVNANSNFLVPIDQSKLATAGTWLQAAIDSYLHGSDLIRARSALVADQYLIHLKEADRDREQIFRNTLTSVRASLSGSADIDLGKRLGGPAQVDLSKFFGVAPDIRSLLPQFTTQNKLVPNTFPDPTFQSILPQFTQAEWTRRLNLFDDKDFILYDDFNAGAIDSGRWLDQELVREIRGGALFFRNTRTSASGNSAIAFVNPSSINSVAADVTVTAIQSPDNRARAFVQGVFHQSGSPGGPGDFTNVILADINIRQGTGGPSAQWFISRCANFDCSSDVTLASGVVKSVAGGQTVNLSLAYDQALSQFTFSADDVSVTQLSPAAVTGPPNVQWKAIGTRISGAGAYTGIRSISATFDNVKVNGVLYDDFSAGSIDPTKWTDREIVREVSAGKLVSAVTAFDAPQANRLHFSNQNGIAGIKADVTITAVSNSGALPRARLVGDFYNSTSSPPGNQTGEVQGYIDIRHTGTNLEAQWHVLRCTDSLCNNGTTLGSGTFGVVNLGETHTLSVVWDGSAFTFGMDGATQAFDPKPLAPVVQAVSPNPWMEIGTKIDNATAGTGGSIRATFDNVYVRLNPNVNVDVPTIISGRIFAAENLSVGLEGVGVVATALDGVSGTFTALTGPDGTYSIAVPFSHAEYILWATLPGRQTRYFATGTDTGLDALGASRIGVTEGFVTDKDILLALGASISGKVTTGGGITPLAGANVSLFRYNGNIFGLSTTSTATASDGTYRFSNLTPGDYSVRAFLPGFAIKFYNGTPDSGSADYFSLGTGQSQSNVNLDLDAATGSISGKVTNAATALPIGTANVVARGLYPRNGWVWSVNTDGGGNYTITGLTPGRYKIEVRASGFAEKFYSNGSSRDEADPITVTAGATTSGINVALNSPNGAISGFVLDANGTPVTNISVGAWDRSGNSVRYVSPNGDGSYTIPLLPPGIYRVAMDATETGFINQFYNGQRVFGAADDVVVTAGATTSGINFTLASNPGRILGTITRSDTGAPVLGASISVRTINNDYSGGDTSRASGTYLVRGLAPGQYKVRVNHPDFVTRYFSPAGGAATFDSAALVTVTANTDTINIDVALDPNPGQITGKVTELDGTTPLAGVSIAARVLNELHSVRYATTRSDGTYELLGLAPGSYIIRASLPGRAVQFYNAKLTHQAGDLVSVSAGGTTPNINFALSPVFGSLSGRVTLTDGTTGVEGAGIVVYDAATGGWVGAGATTNATGYYTVSQLPPGSYKVAATALGYTDRYFLAGQPGAANLALASAVTVTAGVATPGVNIRLSVSGGGGGQTYTLTMTRAGLGSGTVTSSPAGINCGATCIADFDAGTNVTLAAVAAAGSTFTGWSGEGCTGTGTCTVNVTQTRNVTATFMLYPLIVTKSGTGSGTVTSNPAGINCGATCNADFDAGTNVTLTAVATAGSTFTGWSGEGCSGTDTCVVSTTQARYVTATFMHDIPPQPGMSLYDDFAGSAINSAKWQNLEQVREIRGGKLAMVQRQAGPPGYPSNTLTFSNPAAIQSFQADARLNAYTPPPGGASRVRLAGFYYNDGTGGPGQTGDVGAELYLAGTSSGVDIRYNVWKCTNSNCSTATGMSGSGTTVKSAALGEVHTLGIGWDGSVFTFTVDGVPTVVDPRPFQPIGRSTPNTVWKVLSTQFQFLGAGSQGYVAGDFDNVVVNGIPYDSFDGPPFSGPRLDPTRWASLELVRELDAASGRFISKTAGAGGAGAEFQNRLRFVNQKAITALRTDVTVTDFQSTNSSVTARLKGTFYNDGASTGGTDSTGDVVAHTRLVSRNGGPLTAEFLAERCTDPACNTSTPLFADSLGALNQGEQHTLLLAWDGSLSTYGIDGTSRAFDPKPLAPVVKPPVMPNTDVRTSAFMNAPGGSGYIAATFDNVYVNNEALALPRLAPFYQQVVTGDVTSAGVGLRMTGTGTIHLTGIPAGATIQKALLYWATLGKDGTFTSPTLNGTAVNGVRIGKSDDPFLGAAQSFAYRADVTSLISGNGYYTVAGLPALGPEVNDSEGASLVVIYSLPGAPSRVITINDGAFTLSGSRQQYYATPLSGFQANPAPGSKLTFVLGDGQFSTPEYAGLNTTLLAANSFSGREGTSWDTRTYDVSSAIPSGATSANAVVSTGNDSHIWVAAILSVPGNLSDTPQTFLLTVTKASNGSGSVTSTPAGIDCGPTCSATFDSGTSVTLTGTLPTGSTFAGWSGDCSGTGACAVDITQARNVTATFTLQTFALNVTKTGTGNGSVTSSPAAIDCGGTCSASYDYNTSVTLTAAAASGSSFNGWSGEGCSGLGTCTVSLTQARSVTARFTAIPPLPTLSLYDDFSGSTIDAAKWQSLEIVREIGGGKLVSSLRASGAPSRANNELNFANPTAIQSFQADVRLNSYSSPAGGATRVRLNGSFYSDSTGPKPAGDFTGDVLGQLYLFGASGGVDIRYRVVKCTIPDCSSGTIVVPETTVQAAALGESHTLGIAWDGAQFTFTVDGVSQPPVNPADCSKYPTTCQPIINPFPNVPFKLLGTQVQFAGAGGVGSVAGDFDNVYVNGVLYDNFDGPPYSGPRLSSAKWADLELVREIQGGHLVSKVAVAEPAGNVGRSRLFPVNQNAVASMQADVRVTEFQSNSGWVRAQLTGSFYNDGSSTGANDSTGEVEAYMQIASDTGGQLYTRFYAARCTDSQCNTSTVLNNFFDSFGAVNLGETHTLFLRWDGSVFTYGMDGTIRTFDPKPYAAVNKPPVEHYKQPIYTRAQFNTGSTPVYIAAIFDNVLVNEQALALPHLAPSVQVTVVGDVTTAGVGLRETGAGTINLAGIPTGATVQKALLYWATLGTSGGFTSPTLNGTPVTGTLIGQSDDPWWGTLQSFAYRADVTSLVSGNGSYAIAGLPAGPLTVNDSQGASLVVIYSLPGSPSRVVTINDGTVTLIGSRVQYYATPLSGFTSADPPTGAKLTFLVGDGQSSTPEYAGLNTTLLATNEFSGSNGNYWDARTYDASAALAPGATGANAVLSTGNDSLVWVAAILSVPEQTYALTITGAGTGSGTVASTPAGIDCGATCSAAFTTGTDVTLTATPATGSTFTGWSGDCTGTGTCQVTMNQARNVTATFTLQTFALTIMAWNTDGELLSMPTSVYPADTNGQGAGTTTFTRTYPHNAVVTLVAEGSGGFVGFQKWQQEGVNVSTNPIINVTMDANHTLTAVYSAIPYTLTVNSQNPGNGVYVSISPSQFGQGDGSTPFTQSRARHTGVTLTAPATAGGNSFQKWQQDGVDFSTNATISITMDADHTLTAVYAPPVPLTVAKAGTGSGRLTSTPIGLDCGATCSASFDYNASVTLTATPALGSVFTGWSGEGCTGTGTCTLTMTQARNVTATFTLAGWVSIGPEGGSVKVLAIDPIAPTTLYAGTDGGIFKTTNAGTTWSSINAGLTNTLVRALAIHPTTPTTIYAGTYGGGIFKSTDGGANWTPVNSDLTQTGVYALAIDPTSPTTLYAGTGGGIFKTTSGGASWSATALTEPVVYALAIDPTTPTTVYAGAAGGGILKSTTGGASWSATVMTTDTIYALAIDPTAPTTVYMGSYGGGIFKTTAGGASWSPVNTGLTNLYVHALAVDPITPTTLYAGTDAGIFKTSSGGASWNANGLYNSNVQALALHPTVSTTVYAGTYGSGVFALNQVPRVAQKIGIFREGLWYLDYNGNGAWDGCGTDTCASWGSPGDLPVLGDWNGDGKTEYGIVRNGTWFLDYNGNYAWDGCGVDKCIAWGDPGDTFIVGDWNGDGKTKIGVYRSGTWYLDYNGNGLFDGCDTDKCIGWGGDLTDKVVVGDWNGDGRTKIGVYRNGTWYLDYNGNGLWDGCGTDKCIAWGDPGDTFIVGDWNGDGKTKIGIYRNGTWYLDYNGNGLWDGCGTDKCISWGGNPEDKPVIGDWNGDGKAKVGIVRNGTWYLDANGNGIWDGCGTDQCSAWGSAGDTFIVGRW